MSIKQLSLGIEQLAKAGLNLYAVLDCEMLPQKMTAVMQETAVPLHYYTRLVMLGHGGRQFWEAMSENDWKVADPIDTYSIRIANLFIEQTLPSFDNLFLFPKQNYLIPLQQLGELAGWCHPSPLGLGISPQFGVWYAYRAAFLTSAPLPLTSFPTKASPCDSCQTKPCIFTCPVEAVGNIDQFNLTNCAEHRIAVQSSCADRCLARMACPIAPEHRYSLAQINYHYRHSLDSIKNYIS